MLGIYQTEELHDVNSPGNKECLPNLVVKTIGWDMITFSAHSDFLFYAVHMLTTNEFFLFSSYPLLFFLSHALLLHRSNRKQCNLVLNY